MGATQSQTVVRPKSKNMETKDHTMQGGGRRNTRDFAGTWHHQGTSNFKPKEARVRFDLMEENAALKIQLEDSQFRQHLNHCKWEAVERKSQYLMAHLEEVHSEHKNFTAGAEVTIKELKDQLERAKNNETWFYEEMIQGLKFELREACVERINAVNRLILSDKIMASLNLKLDEANKKLAQLEQQQGENGKTVGALKRAEEEKALLQQTLRENEEKWTTMKTSLDDLESRMNKESDTKSKRCWLVRLFK